MTFILHVSEHKYVKNNIICYMKILYMNRPYRKNGVHEISFEDPVMGLGFIDVYLFQIAGDIDMLYAVLNRELKTSLIETGILE